MSNKENELLKKSAEVIEMLLNETDYEFLDCLYSDFNKGDSNSGYCLSHRLLSISQAMETKDEINTFLKKDVKNLKNSEIKNDSKKIN